MTDLTPDARDRFREALTSVADSILERPDAAETMARFFDGRLAMMLTDKALFVLDAQEAAAAVRASLRETPDGDSPGHGMYL